MRVRILFSCFCLLQSLFLAAQPPVDYAPLTDRLAEYGQLTMKGNVDGLLDLTCPDLFEIVPRNLLRDQMDGLQSDENMAVIFHDFTVDQIGESILDHGVTYVPLDCHHGITFVLRSEAYRSPDFSDRLIRMLEKTYADVRFNTADYQIEVVAPKAMFAIRRTANGDWFFVEYRPENAALMDLLVPPAVWEQMK